jgi:arginyl-tRNA--protein-N-Asp/Glu arginylyltransferase
MTLFRNLDEPISIQKKTAVPKMPPFTTLADGVHLAESVMHADRDSVHSFEVRFTISSYYISHISLQIVLEPASYTPQKFALFNEYQREIHHDVGSSPSSFKQFLVDSPLQVVFAVLVLCLSC